MRALHSSIVFYKYRYDALSKLSVAQIMNVEGRKKRQPIVSFIFFLSFYTESGMNLSFLRWLECSVRVLERSGGACRERRRKLLVGWAAIQ